MTGFPLSTLLPHSTGLLMGRLGSFFRIVLHFTFRSMTHSSPVAQLLKNLPALQETLVRFLGQEDPLEKGQAIHSSLLGLPWWLRW